jgi:hypothetical protein
VGFLLVSFHSILANILYLRALDFSKYLRAPKLKAAYIKL